MMRIPIVVGNWKMHTTVPQALALVDAMLHELPFVAGVEKVVCPPFIALEAVRGRLLGTGVLVGAQNAFWAPSGAYTGEVSAAMLQGLVDYVILGHSERRKYFHETDEDVNRKVRAALQAGLRVILCVGEDLAVNEAGGTDAFVEGQVRAALDGVDLLDRVVVAYEPIWAIGTGVTPSCADIAEMHAFMRKEVMALIPEGGDTIRLLYGGSVKPSNAAEILAVENVDGALVGGASLKSKDFMAIAAVYAKELSTAG